MERKEFELLARKLRPTLLSTALRILEAEEDAEDIVQDTMLKLWLIRNKLAIYRSVEALAIVAVRNLCISQLRKQKFNIIPLDNTEQRKETDLAISDEHTPQKRLEENEDDSWLTHTINGLPSSQMTILKMSQDGMSNKEIANTLGIKETSVRTALCKARNKLLEELKKRK